MAHRSSLYLNNVYAKGARRERSIDDIHNYQS